MFLKSPLRLPPFHFGADPDSAFHFDADPDPDPHSQNDASPDPDPQHCCPLSLRLTPFLPLFMLRSSLLGNRNANPLSNQL